VWQPCELLYTCYLLTYLAAMSYAPDEVQEISGNLDGRSICMHRLQCCLYGQLSVLRSIHAADVVKVANAG